VQGNTAEKILQIQKGEGAPVMAGFAHGAPHRSPPPVEPGGAVCVRRARGAEAAGRRQGFRSAASMRGRLVGTYK